MDPVTLGAVLTAVVTGTSEALSAQLWSDLLSLIRRSGRGKRAAGDQAALPRGEPELMALQHAPHDHQKAVALAELLLARAKADADFSSALAAWWGRAEPVQANTGDVTNTISGGTQYGPVVQGRNFGSITFGPNPPRSPAQPRDPDAS